MAPDGTLPRCTGASHEELTVRDPDRSAAWHERVLGMEVVAEHEEELFVLSAG